MKGFASTSASRAALVRAVELRLDPAQQDFNQFANVPAVIDNKDCLGTDGWEVRAGHQLSAAAPWATRPRSRSPVAAASSAW